MRFPAVIAALSISFAPLPAAFAQSQPAPSEAATLAQGWALLAKGDAAGAAVVAARELQRDQNSQGALVLAVDADLARGGAIAGLAAYEKWLGNRRLESPHVLRRVARVMLVESSQTQPNTKARLDALTALAADGDRAAAATLERAALSNGVGETRALASMGNERAVTSLIAQLRTTRGSRTSIIEALADSGSRQAVPQLIALLSDQNDMNRASAAEGLGRLNAVEAIPQLQPLLQDPVFTVRLKAAGALFRLNDSSGLSLLADLTANEHGAIRLAAARELASRPDVAWQGMVRNLTSDPDPLVRVESARLIAPYDQQLAGSVLDALMRDDNVGIREAASDVLIERVASDFATLRGLLRANDSSVRVRAAGRILELTR